MRTLFVHEFVAGGGFADRALPPHLLLQGQAMLEALLADLARAKRRRIVTTLDQRVSAQLPPEIEVAFVTAGSHTATFRTLAAEADEVWVIAPETSGHLAALTRLATQLSKKLIGASLEAILLATDKLRLCRKLAEVGIPVPRTWPAAEAERAHREVGFPLVAKPAVGAGCEGVGLARDPKELAAALERARATGGRAIVQQYIDGTPASASVLCTEERSRPLSLNGQHVHVGRSFSYAGGCVPLRHPSAKKALAVSCEACEVVPGLAGYVGLDLILSPNRPVLLEMNPRLTTSYVGLRAATDLNLAELILEEGGSGDQRYPLPTQRTVQFTTAGSVRTLGEA